MSNKNDTNFGNRIRSILIPEVRYIIAIALFVFGGVKPYFEIREDISLIKNDISNINANHITHLQDLKQDVKELQTEHNMIAKEQADLSRTMIDLQRQILNNK